MAYRRVLTMKEIEGILESDEEIENPIDSITALPPDTVDVVTDEEIIDEDLIPINDMEPATCELAGTFEIINANDEQLEELELTMPSTAADETPPTKRVRSSYKELDSFGKPKWTKKSNANKQFDFPLQHNAEPLEIIQKNLSDKISGLSPLQLFELFFDKEMFDFIVMQSNTYAQQKGRNIVINDRIAKAPLRTGKQLQRGESDYLFDRTNSILVCRWADNKEVTALTNFEQVEPMRSVKRWKKDVKKYENVPQPLLLSSYNTGMGGVDLHDNAVSNYRINIRSKKWYWPLFISVLSSSLTNAWKLHCFLEKGQKKKVLSQKDFRVSVSKALLLTSKLDSESFEDRSDRTVSFQLPRIVGEHIPVVQPQGKPRRCQLKGCGKPIKWMCQKCNVHLHPQCFENFHSKQNKL